MAVGTDFHSQLSSIMDTLAKAAVLEISQLVDGGYAVLRLEISRSQEENKRLRKQLENLQYMVAQGGAEVPEPPPDGAVVCDPAISIKTDKDENEDVSGQLDCEMTTSLWNAGKPRAVTKCEDDDVSNNLKVLKTEEDAEDLESGGAGDLSDCGAQAMVIEMHSEEDEERSTGRQKAGSAEDRDYAVVFKSEVDDVAVNATAKPNVLRVKCGSLEAAANAEQSDAPDPECEPLNQHYIPPLSPNSSHNAGDTVACSCSRHYSCTFCGKSFKRANYLKNHSRIHTGEKPYSCKHCSKQFARASSVREHEKIHLDEKPFVCRFCARTFARSRNLKSHLRIHTGEKPFICRFCDFRFTQARALKAHLRIHTV